MTSTQKYLEQAKEIFNSFEKWNAFLELYKIKDQLRGLWFQELEDAVCRKVNCIPDLKNKWSFRKDQINSYGWYINEHGEDSLLVCFDYNQFCIYIDGEEYDRVGIIEKYRKTKLFNLYFNDNEIITNSKYRAAKKNIININGISDYDSLAYYANKKSSEHHILVDKISQFFLDYLNDIEIYNIINEIGNEFKINKNL